MLAGCLKRRQAGDGFGARVVIEAADPGARQVRQADPALGVANAGMLVCLVGVVDPRMTTPFIAARIDVINRLGFDLEFGTVADLLRAIIAEASKRGGFRLDYMERDEAAQ